MTPATHGELENAMPDPESNVQLGENSGLAILGGAVSTQFTYDDPAEYADALERVRQEQELICGYPLRVGDVREMQMQDTHRMFFEVFVTFEPAEQA